MPSGPAFISHGEYLFERNFPNALPKGAHSFYSPLNALLIDFDLRDKAGHSLAAAGNGDALAALDIVEDAKEMRFGFGCLNCLHKWTSRFDWLSIAEMSAQYPLATSHASVRSNSGFFWANNCA